MEEREGENRVLEGKPEERKPLLRHRHRWEYNTKMDLQEIDLGGGLD
jgi:hypothetical protein